MLRLYSNTWLYVPWVWPEHVEALDETAFVDTKWGVWGSVMSYVPWHLHSLLKGGVKRLFGVVDQYSCVLGIKRCKLHGDTYLCKIAEPVSWSLDLCSFFGRGLAGPVMRVITERVLRRKTVDIRKVEKSSVVLPKVILFKTDVFAKNWWQHTLEPLSLITNSQTPFPHPGMPFILQWVFHVTFPVLI